MLLLGLSLQVHTSGFILCFLSVLLFASGRLKVSWTGFAVGVAACLASLVPWFLAVRENAALMPGGKGFVLRGLVYVFPLLRGILYWLKVSSLSFVARMYDLDFTPLLGATVGPLVSGLAKLIATVAGVSLILTLWLQWRFFRNAWRRSLGRVRGTPGPRAWLRSYVMATGVAALICFALSPTTIMFWQLFVAPAGLGAGDGVGRGGAVPQSLAAFGSEDRWRLGGAESYRGIGASRRFTDVSVRGLRGDRRCHVCRSARTGAVRAQQTPALSHGSGGALSLMATAPARPDRPCPGSPSGRRLL